MNEITRLVVGTAMRSMFQKGWVDICTIRECLKLAGVLPVGDAYQMLTTLHCVHFKDMPAELASEVPRMLRDVFNGLSVDDLVKATEPAKIGSGRNGADVLKLR